MVRHLRRLLQRAAVLQIRGDPGGAEAVIADLGHDAGRRRAASDHRIGVGLGQGRCGELVGTATDGAEQRSLGVRADPGLLDI